MKAERATGLGIPNVNGRSPFVSVAEEGFFLVDKDTLEPIAAARNTGMSYTSADQLLDDLYADNPEEMQKVEIVPGHDLEMMM